MAARPAAGSGRPRHGGALLDATRRWGIPVSGWLDLSTGINPLPYPLSPPADDITRRLPDPDALEALNAAARALYGAPADTAVVAVPGTDIALRLLPMLEPRTTVAVLTPTYSGHAEAWGGAGHELRPVGDLDAADDADIVILANPNNPDGRRIAPEQLATFAARPRRLLVVDEAFCDLDPALSLVPRLSGRAVVLRSFGKFYGLAGLRLGFVIGAPSVVGGLARLLGAWPVSGPAMAAGIAALADRDWADATRRRLAADRARLDHIIAAAIPGPIAGTDLFRLLRTPRAAALHEALARRGIWTRIFAEDAAAIRIGLPPPEDFPRLESAFAAAAAEAAG